MGGSWTRRAFLELGALSLLTPALMRRRPADRGPRYLLVVFLGGGVDAILTTDPRTRSEVEGTVDLPYRPDEIVEAGALRLGPHLAGLAPWAGRTAILNGVRVGTANHITGRMQVARFRTRVSPLMPTLLDVIGAHRDGQALGSLTLGVGGPHLHSPSWFGSRRDGAVAHVTRPSLFERLDRTDPDDLTRLARALQAQAARLTSGGGEDPARRATAAHMEEAATLFQRVREAPAFRAEPFTSRPGMDFARALWAFEHDLARCVLLVAGQVEWDTHRDNLIQQRGMTLPLVDDLARFLGELQRRRNARGSLLDQTLVVVGSELGRFPRLNGEQGKDHFPEAPYLFIGAGVRAGGRGAVYGATGRSLEALPVSLDTGAPATGGHHVTLDDVGTTLLRLFGVDPARNGYRGRELRFLVEGA